MRKPKFKKPEEELLESIKKSGLLRSDEEESNPEEDDIEHLSQRIKKINALIANKNKKHRTMTYFVMYDIENDKVRRLVARYLEKKGLIRIQKSIFIADTDHLTFDEITKALKETQQAFENNDSYILAPISIDELRAMKIIGKNVNIDFITGDKSTLFF